MVKKNYIWDILQEQKKTTSPVKILLSGTLYFEEKMKTRFEYMELQVQIRWPNNTNMVFIAIANYAN